jgi:hypothetical protein
VLSWLVFALRISLLLFSSSWILIRLFTCSLKARISTSLVFSLISCLIFPSLFSYSPIFERRACLFSLRLDAFALISDSLLLSDSFSALAFSSSRAFSSSFSSLILLHASCMVFSSSFFLWAYSFFFSRSSLCFLSTCSRMFSAVLAVWAPGQIW